MNKHKSKRNQKRQSPAPVKPANPDTEGAPNNQDPKAQYEDKDNS